MIANGFWSLPNLVFSDISYCVLCYSCRRIVALRCGLDKIELSWKAASEDGLDSAVFAAREILYSKYTRAKAVAMTAIPTISCLRVMREASATKRTPKPIMLTTTTK